MKYFCAVAKYRGFTRASQKLNITQQTLSAHIASIEKETGCQLFVRSTPLELTYAGAAFYNYAKQFDMLYASMETEMADIRSEQSGMLMVGIAHTRGRAIMPDIIRSFHSEHPQITIQIVEATNEILKQKLINGELDLAIAELADDKPEIQTQVFYDEEVVLFVSRSLLLQLYGKNTEDVILSVKKQGISVLRDCPFLLNYHDDIAGRIGNSIIADASFVPKVVAQSSNVETLLELCADAKGACFCPKILVRKALSAETLAGMHEFYFGDKARYTIKFGWPRQAYCSKMVEEFIQTARSVVY